MQDSMQLLKLTGAVPFFLSNLQFIFHVMVFCFFVFEHKSHGMDKKAAGHNHGLVLPLLHHLGLMGFGASLVYFILIVEERTVISFSQMQMLEYSFL